jgi:dinuclear metal center YbgI/SA1388 family protein
MTTIRQITSYLETIAPPQLQESYDNAGLLTGNVNDQLNGILLTLDCTEEVVEEAIRLGCNLIVAHHPIIFKGLKSITGKNYVERTIIKAIKNDIAIFASHTNLDSVSHGVNYKISQKIGLQNTSILAPKSGILKKLVVFVPKENTDELLEALHKAGAGNIGKYSHCSFRSAGKGRFKPGEEADPHIGKANKLEEVEEEKLELIVPANVEQQVLKAMLKAHPYEEVAHFVTTLDNQYQEVGSGMIGDLPEPMEPKEFLLHLKEKMQLQCIRHTPLISKKVQKVALCGGSGSFLLKDAIRRGADAFVTADFKYHEFFDAEGKLVIADIGHYESEIFTKELFFEILSEKFANIAVNFSKIVTNPVSYI